MGEFGDSENDHNNQGAQGAEAIHKHFEKPGAIMLEGGATLGQFLAKAQAAAAAAAAAADAARAQVAAQKLKVAEAQQRMNDLKAKIAEIARQTYINGNESVELGLLLDARDPADFATQVGAIKRTARGNDVIFEQLAALQAQLADTLAQLKAYEQQVANQERVAQDRRDDADRSRNAAASAKAELAPVPLPHQTPPTNDSVYP